MSGAAAAGSPRASVERFSRAGDGWTRATFGPGETLELASLGMVLALDESYANLPPDAARQATRQGVRRMRRDDRR